VGSGFASSGTPDSRLLSRAPGEKNHETAKAAKRKDENQYLEKGRKKKEKKKKKRDSNLTRRRFWSRKLPNAGKLD